MLDSLTNDVRFAIRTLARSRGFTFVAVASLALGIGANSAIFSLVRATVFPSLPYRDVAKLVNLSETSPDLCPGCGVGTSLPTYLDWKTQTRTFENMGASREEGFVIAGGPEAVSVSGALVSASLFPTLGVGPAIGRAFTSDDDRLAAPRVVLISYGVWEQQFGADSSLVGKTIRVNGVPATLVGVMPRGFGYPEFAKMWMPIGAATTSMARDDRTVAVVARLARGMTREQAQREVAAISAAIAPRFPAEFRGWTATATTVLEALRGDSGPPFLILLGASAFVLLIACANLANLMLARGARREREIAVRLALGAGRARLVRMLLAECFVVSVAGAGLGLLLAMWGVDAVPRLLSMEIPFWIVFKVDWRVVAFAVAMAGLTALTFGLLPALRSSRPGLVDSLKEGAQATTAGGRRGRLRSALVVAQISLALVLLTGAGLMVKTFARGRSMNDLGYDPRNVLTARVQVLTPVYDDAGQVSALATRVEDRVASVPGVTATAVENREFLGTFVGTDGNMTIEGSATAVPDNIVPRFSMSVGADYFAVRRIGMRRGRTFARSDRMGAPGVAILNDVAAQALWPSGDAIGKRIKLGKPNDDKPWLTVVGIAANTVAGTLNRTRPMGFVYVPFAQNPGRPFTVLARTAGPPVALAPALRAEIRAADPDAAVDAVSSLEAELRSGISGVRFFVMLLGGLAALALALAALGLYGVVSYAITQRTREIGIRMALGATATNILKLVVGYGVVMTTVGVTIGAVGSFALTGVLRGVLFGTSTRDPLVFISVSLALAAVSLMSCYAPARRATRVEPVIALRSE